MDLRRKAEKERMKRAAATRSDRDNSDSEAKCRLGRKWAELSGSSYRYMMVFDKKCIDGAFSHEKAKELIRQM